LSVLPANYLAPVDLVLQQYCWLGHALCSANHPLKQPSVITAFGRSCTWNLAFHTYSTLNRQLN